jgi:hypothetical protein
MKAHTGMAALLRSALVPGHVGAGSSREEVVVTTHVGESPCTAVRREDLVPLCPHCEVELHEIFQRKPGGPFGIGKGYLFFCLHCWKLIGSGTQWYPFPGR